jgi:hypothetical protein
VRALQAKIPGEHQIVVDMNSEGPLEHMAISKERYAHFREVERMRDALREQIDQIENEPNGESLYDGCLCGEISPKDKPCLTCAARLQLWDTVVAERDALSERLASAKKTIVEIQQVRVNENDAVCDALQLPLGDPLRSAPTLAETVRKRVVMIEAQTLFDMLERLGDHCRPMEPNDPANIDMDAVRKRIFSHVDYLVEHATGGLRERLTKAEAVAKAWLSECDSLDESATKDGTIEIVDGKIVGRPVDAQIVASRRAYTRDIRERANAILAALSDGAST